MIYTANMYGYLVKIKPNRKLLVRVDQKTFDRVNERYAQEMDNNGYENEHSPLWATEDGDFFITLTLDRYDRFNMRKFEALIRCNIIFTFNYVAYAFTPVGADEEVNGVTLTLTTIRRAAAARASPSSSSATRASSDPSLAFVLGVIDKQTHKAVVVEEDEEEVADLIDEAIAALHQKKQEGHGDEFDVPPSLAVLSKGEVNMLKVIAQQRETITQQSDMLAKRLPPPDPSLDDVDRMLAQRQAAAAEPLNPLEAHLDNVLSQRLPLGRPPLVRQNGFQEWLSMAREIGEKSIHRRRAPPS